MDCCNCYWSIYIVLLWIWVQDNAICSGVLFILIERSNLLFIFDWLKKDDSPNSDNIILRIKVLRIMKLITKHECSRCSNKFYANAISNVWRLERRILSLRPGLRLLSPVNPFENPKNKHVQ